MNIGAGTALLAVIASALFCMTSAKNVACINANAKILKLYCDGVDLTSQLTWRSEPNQCDCITLPICKIIAIKAKGVRNYQESRSGIQFCQTASPASFHGLDWVCAHAPRVPGKSWIRESYNHNQWKSVMRPDGTCRTCHGIKFLPCTSKCFWNLGKAAKSVNCVRKQCADMCNSCDIAGPGGCDPGQCAYGETVDPKVGQPVCNHKCRVDWKAWTGASGKGYIKVTDMRSNTVDTYEADVSGWYQAMLDLNSCSLTYREYVTWETGYGTSLNDRANALPESVFANSVGLLLGVGTNVDSPYLGAIHYGTNPTEILLGDPTGADVKGTTCSASAIYTGITGVKPTEEVLAKIKTPC